jgi:AcrR family transcriptional regulator
MNTFKFPLTTGGWFFYNLNMFKKATAYKHSADTRSRILSTALTVFRQQGLDAATMREISKQAGVALGAAYYYFPSKEAIIQAYYDDVQNEHYWRVRAALLGTDLDLEGRLRAAFHAKLDIVQGDRKILGALFRYTGEPDHPLSVFGEGTRKNRDQSTAAFALAIGENLPEDIRAFLPIALWALHMGILLYFIYDTSPQQQRTRKLVDGALKLLVHSLSLAKVPLLKPFRGRLLGLLSNAGLFPEPSSPAPVSVQEK